VRAGLLLLLWYGLRGLVAAVLSRRGGGLVAEYVLFVLAGALAIAVGAWQGWSGA